MSTDEAPEAEDDSQIPRTNQDGYANENDMVANGAVVQNGAVVREMRGNKRAYITVFVLFVINLLNYMDRQTVAGTNSYFQPTNPQRILKTAKLGNLFPKWVVKPPLILQSPVQLMICCLKSLSFKTITCRCFF